MNSLVSRTLTGIVFIAVIIGGIVYSPLSFVAVFSLVTGLLVWEFATNFNRHGGAAVNRLINTVAAVYLFLAFFGFCSGLTPSKVFIPYLVSLLYLLISELYLRQPDPVRNWVCAFASQVYIALPVALLSVLAFRPHYEPAWPLCIFAFLWANDTGAYVFGSLFSRYLPAKLFPRISPKKSWVGSVGGALLCLGAAAVAWVFLPDAWARLQGLEALAAWMGLALTVCVFGTWGDLVESQLKRTLGVKDSGSVLPGHGGFLDRFDSALLAIPASVLYIYTLQFYL